MVRKIKNFLHGYEARAANLLYGNPTKKIKTIAVTGTDGKTTTSSLIFHILKCADLAPAMITTVGAQIKDEQFDTGLHTTTPSSFFLQKYIKKAVDAKCKYLVLEVTSHALDQNRVFGIDVKIGVLTNITHEHLDYHKTYDNYLQTKAKLFRLSDIAVINRDDISYEKLRKTLDDKNVITYSLNNHADYNLKNVKLKAKHNFDFNTQNFLAAISVAKTLGIKSDVIDMAIATFKFPEGRQEIVYEKDFKVIIDFAHTPNSFNSILPALKNETAGRLIHVFGAAGERDKSKRPLMGEIASRHSDIIILTAEDPRKEEIDDINDAIKLGVSKGFEFSHEITKAPPHNQVLYEISDRQKAIDYAIKIANVGDTVVVTGKGHEKSLNLGNGEIPWSDHEAVKKALARANITP